MASAQTPSEAGEEAIRPGLPANQQAIPTVLRRRSRLRCYSGEWLFENGAADEIVHGESVVIKEGVAGLHAAEDNPLVIWLLDHAAIMWIRLAQIQPFCTSRGLSRLLSLEDARRRWYSAIAFEPSWRG